MVFLAASLNMSFCNIILWLKITFKETKSVWIILGFVWSHSWKVKFHSTWKFSQWQIVKKSTMKVGIIFPNTETSRALSAKLLDNGIEVKFLCPAALDVDFAQNYIFELNMICKPPQYEIEGFKWGHPRVSLFVYNIFNITGNDACMKWKIKNTPVFVIEKVFRIIKHRFAPGFV